MRETTVGHSIRCEQLLYGVYCNIVAWCSYVEWRVVVKQNNRNPARVFLLLPPCQDHSTREVHMNSHEFMKGFGSDSPRPPVKKTEFM